MPTLHRRLERLGLLAVLVALAPAQTGCVNTVAYSTAGPFLGAYAGAHETAEQFYPEGASVGRKLAGFVVLPVAVATSMAVVGAAAPLYGAYRDGLFVYRVTSGVPSYEPMEREDWPVQEDPLFGSAVVLCATKPFRLYARVGNGTLIHSCKRHGTYVLTARHMIDGRESGVHVGVFPWNLREDEVAQQEAPFFHYLDAAVVFDPTAAEHHAPSGDTAGTASASDDYVVLKLDSPLRFNVARAGQSHESAEGEAPAIASIAPNGYFHRHHAGVEVTISRAKRRALEVVLDEKDLRLFNDHTLGEGHSGSGIFVGETLIAIVTAAGVGPGYSIVAEAPGIGEIRRALAANDLGWLLRSEDCSETGER